MLLDKETLIQLLIISLLLRDSAIVLQMKALAKKRFENMQMNANNIINTLLFITNSTASWQSPGWEQGELTHTYPLQTSLAPWRGRGPPQTQERCHWCPGPWWWILRGAPGAGWCPCPRPGLSGCTQPSPPCPASSWRGCLQSCRWSQRWCQLHLLTGYTWFCCCQGPGLCVAKKEKKEKKKDTF